MSDRVERGLIKKLKTLGIPVLNFTPYSKVHDASILLGGDYAGVDIQVGDEYYSVVKERGEEFKFVEGDGDILKELKQVMADAGERLAS